MIFKLMSQKSYDGKLRETTNQEKVATPQRLPPFQSWGIIDLPAGIWLSDTASLAQR
jgi:hypothetical protein